MLDRLATTERLTLVTKRVMPPLLACFLLASTCFSLNLCCPIATHQSPVYSESPPAKFVAAWRDATSPFEATQALAITRLSSTPDWEPYFRSAVNSVTDQKLRTKLRSALIACQAPLLPWNMNRAEGWAKEWRLDFITALAVSIDDEKEALILGEYVVAASHKLFGRYIELSQIAEKPPPSHSFFSSQEMTMARLAGMQDFKRYSGDYISIPAAHAKKPEFIHCRSGEFKARSCARRLCLSSEQLVEPDPRNGQCWSWCVVCVNGDATLMSLLDSLIICDGDVTLGLETNGSGSCHGSTIICNGNLTMADDFAFDYPSVAFAAGDFSGPKEIWRRRCSIFVGGKNPSIPETKDAAFKEFYSKYFPQGVKENPFGVKFVSPADVGVELAVGVKVVRLGEMKASSPIAKAGLEKGDRIMKLNGVNMETAADFRRQLRESLLWGKGLFEVKRGDKTFLCLITFAEPPKKP